MKKTLQYAGLIAILPLLAVALTTVSFTDAYAIKSQGTSAGSYGSSNSVVCGDRLCSEYPGGREAFRESMMTGLVPAPVVDDDHMEKMDKHDGDRMMEKGDHMEKDRDHMEKDGKGDYMKKDRDHMKDGDHMKKDKDHMEKDGHMKLRLSRANVPATIPMHMGYYDGEPVHYIITDSSDQTHADVITQKQGWTVELAPVLGQAPETALSKTYFFANGIKGDGIHDYQEQVFTTIPGMDGYSALTSHIHVTWNDESDAKLLKSEAEIMEAKQNGEITMVSLEVVLNMPHIMWPGGMMTVAEKTLTDYTPYGGGQVLNIDTDAMEVTFIAHRGWGPDGRTIYYIVTDATPAGAAEKMGVVSTPSSASLIANAAAVDLYQFKNGIRGSGPLGYQPGIATGAPGDANYSPMWRILVVGWEDPHDAAVMETIADINAYKAKEMITIEVARPMDSDHIVNCPFIDPFQ